MAVVSWKAGVSGSFIDPTKWSTGVVPGLADDVFLTASGRYTVDLTGQRGFHALTTGAGVTLAIGAGSSLDAPTGLTNAGAIRLASTGKLTLGGTVANTGLIATTTGSQIRIAGAVLTGTGRIELNNATITSAGALATLDNAGNTIAGWGTLGATGASGLNLINQAAGVITATQTSNTSSVPLTVTGNRVENAGLMESTGFGRLVLTATSLVNTGSIVSRGDDGTVNGVSLWINQATNANTVMNSGLIAAASHGGAYMGGQVTNTGTIASTGGGTFTLSGLIDNRGGGNAGVLQATGAGSVIELNRNTVVMGGHLDAGTGARFSVLSTLTLDGSSAGAPLSMSGTVALAMSAVVTLKGAVSNAGTVTANTGSALKIGGPSGVVLTGGGRIELTNASIASAGTATSLVNVDNTITGFGTLGAAGATGLDVINRAGGVVNAAYLNPSPKATTATLTVAGNRVENAGLMESTGIGVLALAAGTLVNTGQILGLGYDGTVNGISLWINQATNANTVVNSGLIAAASRSGAFMGGQVANTGTIASTGGGKFTLSGLIDNRGGGNAGILRATGDGSVIELSNNLVVMGGRLEAGTGARFTVLGPLTLDGSSAGAPLSTSGTVALAMGATVALKGAVANGGSIVGNTGAGFTIGGPTGVVLTGGGRIELKSGSIASAGAATKLENVDNTIVGWGTLGASGTTGLDVINRAGGVINASYAGANGATLIVTARSLVDNAGLMESTATGALDIRASRFVNTGQVVSMGFAGNVNSATLSISGGEVLNTGSITSASRAGASLGGTVVNRGIVASTGAGVFRLSGTLTNETGGVIRAEGVGSQVILDGWGSGNARNAGRIESTGGGSVTIATATFENTGVIAARGGDVRITTAVTGGGSAVVGDGARLALEMTSTAGVGFLSHTLGILQLDAAATTGPLSGFDSSHVLDLRGMTFGSGSSVSYAGSAAGGTLTVGNGSMSRQFQLVGDYTGVAFKVTRDAIGGTYVTESATTVGTAGNDTLVASAGAKTLIGLGGSDIYQVGVTGSGGVEIVNGVAASRAPAGELLFGAGVSSKQLWFERVDDAGHDLATGNNLRIDVLGTSQHVTIDGWFNADAPGARLADIRLGGTGQQIDAGVATLVAAMATFEAGYQAAHGVAFDPTAAANAAITDPQLLAAVTGSWH